MSISSNLVFASFGLERCLASLFILLGRSDAFEVKDELVSVCESIRSAEQDEKRGQAALKAAKDANTRLLEIDIATADPATYPGITAQLDTVITRATKLKDDVANASSKKPAAVPKN